MSISNYFEGADDWRVMLAILLAMCFPVLLASVLKTRWTIGRVIVCSLASSLVFFFVSNLAVWLFSPMYSQDAAGLLRCFTVAVPFLRNTVAGDLVWTAILFGTYALLANSLQIDIPRRAFARVRKR